MILSTRPNDDDSRDGFTKWPFMTTHTWAEYPRGKWSLEVDFKNNFCFILIRYNIFTKLYVVLKSMLSKSSKLVEWFCKNWQNNPLKQLCYFNYLASSLSNFLVSKFEFKNKDNLASGSLCAMLNHTQIKEGCVIIS